MEFFCFFPICILCLIVERGDEWPEQRRLESAVNCLLPSKFRFLYKEKKITELKEENWKWSNGWFVEIKDIMGGDMYNRINNGWLSEIDPKCLVRTSLSVHPFHLIQAYLISRFSSSLSFYHYDFLYISP